MNVNDIVNCATQRDAHVNAGIISQSRKWIVKQD